ncbi:hypothetical protein SERLADRAFT_462626 [Serpula lacrymans var. lacrymans S7.9]|uniref:Uncharacterized protein n=1 Tax=Serpula lacrymans var. lacrymans (strain S7.9) TaxID=578457 RepID=F8NP10_SERL9|nr:uncharacterized protein SERLADRAFT_462626 [Serpula lacrymans var. lacrymans S7.9]EGO28109.1 hypothetical protein SERLADRAFT_462626 [Serpula lacrymans var. lacrymans S7.9]
MENRRTNVLQNCGQVQSSWREQRFFWRSDTVNVHTLIQSRLRLWVFVCITQSRICFAL